MLIHHLNLYIREEGSVFFQVACLGSICACCIIWSTQRSRSVVSNYINFSPETALRSHTQQTAAKRSEMPKIQIFEQEAEPVIPSRISQMRLQLFLEDFSPMCNSCSSLPSSVHIAGCSGESTALDWCVQQLCPKIKVFLSGYDLEFLQLWFYVRLVQGGKHFLTYCTFEDKKKKICINCLNEDVFLEDFSPFFNYWKRVRFSLLSSEHFCSRFIS